VAACGSPFDGEVLWQFETKKTYWQSTAVDAQRLYVCSDDVYCLEIETGRLLWEFETFGGHSSAPVIEGDSLFFQSGGLYALDATTGDVLWEFWTKNWATVPPAVDAGRVYAPAGNRLYCLDATTGKRLWSVKTGIMKKTPVLIGIRIFFSVGDTIVCLDASNGQVLWRFKTGSDRVRLAVAGGNLFSFGSKGIGRVHKAEDGKVQWQRDTAVFKEFLALPSGQVLISFVGVLNLLNSENGVVLWTFSQAQISSFQSRVLGNHVFAKGFLQREMLCIDLHDGALLRQSYVPNAGLLLTDINGAVFFPGFQSRKIICLSASGL